MEIEKEVDLFLTPRPWWKLSFDSGKRKGSYMLIFERYPRQFKPYLDHLVETQFIPLGSLLFTSCYSHSNKTAYLFIYRPMLSDSYGIHS